MTQLSQRALGLGTENAFVVLAEVNKLIREGHDIISFCIGQPDFPTPKNIQQAGLVAVDTETTSLDSMQAQLVGISLGVENRYYFHEIPDFEEFGIILHPSRNP